MGESEQPAVSRRRFGRAVLLGGAAAAVVGDEQAHAASTTSGAWLLGGNVAVKGDGTDYLGTKSGAPLIFKTTQKKGTPPAERMRITPTGVVEVKGVAAIGTSPHAKTALTVDSASKNGIAVLGIADKGSGATGVYGSSTGGTGVHGSSLHGYAVYGSTENGTGVRGESYTDGADIAAISGEGLGTQNIGVLGTANVGDSGTGVYGTSHNGTGVHGSSLHGYAVYGSTENGTGVRGESYADDINVAAVEGAGNGAGNTGVRGTGTTGVRGSGTTGVEGRGHGHGCIGVVAYADGADVIALAAYGYDSNYPGDIGRAGHFVGDVDVTGTLSKSGGSFKIDHPVDPANKYLYHSFVESPDMMNVYNGNVTTDSAGRADVTLPDYFMALNSDFRYQLTVIGQFAHAIIGRQIKNGRFEIHTDKPNVLVSWQVSGIRQDAYANANRIPTAVEKPAKERGTYLHPEVHGQPQSANVYYEHDRTPRSR